MINITSKFKLAVMLAVFVIGYNVNAQYFLKSYDLPPYMTSTEIGRSIQPVAPSSSNWTIAGFSNSMPSPGAYNWLFQKLDASGTPVCATLLGFPFDDSCFSHVKFTSSAVNVLSGFYKPFADMREKASWSMIDTGCTYMGSRMILDSLRHQYRSTTIAPGNVFTNAGWIQTFYSPGVTPNKILASQYTPAGALVWAFRYFSGVPSTEQAYSICYQPTDGTYAITGVTNMFTGPVGPWQVFVLKITPAGIPIWFKVYALPMPASSESRKIIPMPDGGFVVAGFTNAFDIPANDVWVFKITAAGFPIWSNVYGFPGISEQSHSIVYQASDMSLIYTGFNTVGATEDIILSKITAAAGATVWTRHYPNTAGSDRGYDIKLYTPSLAVTEYALTGQVFAPPSASLDHFLMRTNSIGIVTTGCLDSLVYQQRIAQIMRVDSSHVQPMPLMDVQVQPQVINPQPLTRTLCGPLTPVTQNNTMADVFELKQNYPNPFNPSTKISFSLPVDGNVSVKVYNAAGKLVETLTEGFKSKGTYSIDFDGSNLSSSVYFYELKTEGFTETKKMLLVK